MRRFWGAPNLAKAEGLKAVQMFEAIADGRIKALWVMGTNPAVSLPRADHVREAMRRLEIPEDMQKKYGFAPLGSANGAIKQAIFGLNSARLYRINLKAADARPMPAYSEDRLAQLKKEYEFAAKEPSNLRY